MTRIVVADDHDVVRQALVAVLDEQPDFDVVGEAADGEQAVEQVVSQQPDVAVIDFNLPIQDGIEATRQVTQQCPWVTVIGFSAEDDPVVHQRMLEAGAAMTLVKDGQIKPLLEAIRRGAAGGQSTPGAKA